MIWLLAMETLHVDKINEGKARRSSSSNKKNLGNETSKTSDDFKSRSKLATVSAMAKRYRELNALVPEITREEGVRIPNSIGARKMDSFFSRSSS